MLERRTFVRVLGGTILSLPYSAEAASEAEVATVGVLMGLAKDEEAEARAKAFEEGLKREGWSVGRNLHLEYRYADGDRALMQTLAIELVRLKCDCILAQSTPVVAALKKVTRTIPIVFVAVSDPIGSGFVASLAHPGGNITGFTVLQATITGKYMTMLRELMPQLSRVAIMHNPESVPYARAFSYRPSLIPQRSLKSNQSSRKSTARRT